MSDFIPFALPDIGEEEINEVVDSLRSGWITTGPKVKRFEKEFGEYVGAKHALAVNSATSGLHLALDAIGLCRGDKVVTSVYTFTATAEVVRYFEADPIFCDIEEDSFNIDCEKLEKLLEELCADSNHKVKAIIPVHISGQSCDMDRIGALAKKYNLKVIEDAAHALPCSWKGKRIGSISDLTVFSFYATKTITTAEGGMVTTENDEYRKRIEVMRLHGFNRDAWDRYNTKKASWYYEVVAPGFKYNMTDIAASLGIHQLVKADNFFMKRNLIAKKYDEAFKDIEGLECPPKCEDDHSYHLYMIQVDDRDSFISKMSDLGIGCSVHFIPLHLQPYWKEKYQLKENDFPMAFRKFKRVVSLPIYTKLSDQEIEKIISSVKRVV